MEDIKISNKKNLTDDDLECGVEMLVEVQKILANPQLVKALEKHAAKMTDDLTGISRLKERVSSSPALSIRDLRKKANDMAMQPRSVVKKLKK